MNKVIAQDDKTNFKNLILYDVTLTKNIKISLCFIIFSNPTQNINKIIITSNWIRDKFEAI